MQPILYVVDAFTNQPFAGNPAAVCVTDSPLPEQLMKNLALEMNLSETAFVGPLNEAADKLGVLAREFSLRWFTPAVEVDLCGHATLSAAHVLWSTGSVSMEAPIRFLTRSGWLTCRRLIDGWIELDFPALPITRVHEDLQHIAQQVGFEVTWAGDNGMDLLVEVARASILRSLTPDFSSIARLPFRGLIVTAATDPEDESINKFDFVSRFYAPAVGVNEDPVTGSAHCTLGPYWQAKTGANEFVAKQISPRGGVVRMRMQGDRVQLSGQAVRVSEIHWQAPLST